MRRQRGMLRVMLVVLVGAAGSAASAQQVAAQSPSPDDKSYGELVAANYVVLSRAESKRLLRFAAAFSSCLTEHGVRVGTPRPAKTRITMAIPRGTDRSRLKVAGS